MMQTNILWTGREYYSLENCLVETTNTGSEITSTILGLYAGALYKVDYYIRTNQFWETVFFEITSRHGNRSEQFSFESDGRGNWATHGVHTEQFEGCMDIDIPLTPFTNSLPINRLHLAMNAEQEIQVIYLDVLQWEIRSVRQKYIRLSETEYHYENVPNDFEAKIVVDQLGLVVDYPSLFVRTAAHQTSYR